MLTQTADYALRGLIYLAHDPDDGYHQTRDLAGTLNVPYNYLGKILQLLGHAGIVESQRGMNGGFRLCRLPDQIRLYDVLAAIDAVPKDPECPLLTGGRQRELCLIHRRFASLTAAYIRFLKETTLEDVLQPDSFPAACPGPDKLPEDVDEYPCTEFTPAVRLNVLSAPSKR
jgi:Rrf2 family transcriptional regulator, nitric oxide-sensitive transcriptional repressor